MSASGGQVGPSNCLSARLLAISCCSKGEILEIDWHKVAVSLNRAASKDLDIALNAKDSDPERAKEFRIRGSILMSIADALFDGLLQEP